jgi:hypothetical protein
MEPCCTPGVRLAWRDGANRPVSALSQRYAIVKRGPINVSGVIQQQIDEMHIPAVGRDVLFSHDIYRIQSHNNNTSQHQSG